MEFVENSVGDIGRLLVKAARETAEQAHAPYSEFYVGAAVIMADDPDQTIFTGCNVENASYGATICAERNAISAAVAAGFRKIHLLALSLPDVAASADFSERTPCGICRQVIHEFCVPQQTLILIDRGIDELAEFDAIEFDQLLPFAFRLRGNR